LVPVVQTAIGCFEAIFISGGFVLLVFRSRHLAGLVRFSLS
jgi:hypothetical protein